MGQLTRASFARGWMPDADSTNGPTDALLRADNLVLDELGAVVVRAGATKINAVALASAAASKDIHSLYTAYLSGTRYRMLGIGDDVFANGISLSATLNGSGDIAFGSHLNQILFARGTSKKKWDGTTLRTWGVPQSGGAATIAAGLQNYKILATCDNAESPGFSCASGFGESTAAIAQTTGQDGTANGAVTWAPASATSRGTMTKVWTAAAADQDFSTYTDPSGSYAATDEDIFQFYVWVTEPSAVQSVTVEIDVNTSDANAAASPPKVFENDYYAYTWISGVPDSTIVDDNEFLGREYTAEGRARRDIESRRVSVRNAVTRIRSDKPLTTAGWNILQARRGQFERVGQTAGKGWNTVRAIRVTVLGTGGAGYELKFDDFRMVGGPVTGLYKWRYVYVYNNSTYNALSAPSAASAEFQAKAQQVTVTAPADASRDSQINEIWVYRMGGNLDAWYRTKVQTSVSGTGAVAITDSLSDRDALIANIRLETDNTTPPDSILDIEGPYYDRTFALTASYLYPSRRINPDSFASGQVIRVADASETAFWVRKALGGLYVGTSKDIYRLDGTGAELADGTIDFTLTPTNIDHPPISAAVAQDGNVLIYLADDGWRAVSGGGSQLLVGATSLLYRGKTRHGVSAVNIASASARFRAAIAKGVLTAVTPEGSDTTTSKVLYRAVLGTSVWYRHVWATPSWRCVLREPDGTLIASDTAGFVWTLDSGTTDDGTSPAVVMWTLCDHNGAPFTRKDPRVLRMLVDTGNVAATVNTHLDNSGTTALASTVTANGQTVVVSDISTIAAFKQVQLRITGSFSTFRLASFSLDYTDLPYPFRGRMQDSPAGYVGEKVLAGFTLRVCTLGALRTFTPYIDNVAQTAFTLTTDTDQPDTYVYQLATPLTGTDISFAVDGDIELYEWTPTVLYQLPLRTLVWENKPLVASTTRRRFGGFTMQVDTEGEAVTVTPYLDGVAQTALTTTTADLLGKALTFDSVCGRDLWCRITGGTAFTVHSVQPIVIETFPMQWKGTAPRSNAGYDGYKRLSGIQVRLCTLGAAVTLTPILDGVSQTALSVTTDANEPEDVTYTFDTPPEAVEIALQVSGNVELYAWTPLVTAKRPLGVTAWDSGPLDLGVPDLTWVREVRVKAYIGADLVVTPYFDGLAWPSVTISSTGLVGTTTVVSVPVGRGYKGRSPRLVITSTAAFYPYYVEVIRRATTAQTDHKPIRMTASVGGQVPA